MLVPILVTSEIARLENVEGERRHDLELATKVSRMSKITSASGAEVWLINLPGGPFNHFYSNDMEGLGLTGVQEVFLASYEEVKIQSRIIMDVDDEDLPINTVVMDSFPTTRASARLKDKNIAKQNSDGPITRPAGRRTKDVVHPDWSSISTSAGQAIVSGDRYSEEHGISAVTPVRENGKITWANVPRQPLPKLDDVDLWIGRQLNHEKMPAKYLYEAPEGELVTSVGTPRDYSPYQVKMAPSG